MKITKLMRAMLIAMSLIMVLSLFACGETPEETTTAGNDVTTDAKTDATTEKGETDAKTESSASDVSETTEPGETIVTTESETNDNTDTESATEGSSETDTSVKTEDTAATEATEETDDNDSTEETEEKAPVGDPDCEHIAEDVPAVPATCSSTGLTAGKKCALCGFVLIAQREIPVADHAWNLGEITQPATCETEGVMTYTCKNDASHTKTETIPAMDHDWDEGKITSDSDCTEKGEMTYTCKNDPSHTRTEVIEAGGHKPGNPDPEDKCNVKCTVCGVTLEPNKHAEYKETFVDKDNVRTYTNSCTVCGESLYTYDVEFNATRPEVFLAPSTLKIHYDLTNAGKFAGGELSADGTYLRISGKPDDTTNDASFMLYAPDPANTPVSGQYLLIKYRTSCSLEWEFFASAGNGHTGAVAGDNFRVEYIPSAADHGNFVADGEWRYMILDLKSLLGDKFVAEADGENAGKYVCNYIRWDIMEQKSGEERYVDVAFAAIADDLSDIIGIDGMSEYTYSNFAPGTDKFAITYDTTTGNQKFEPYFLAQLLKGSPSNYPVTTSTHKDAANNNLPYVTVTYDGDTPISENYATIWGSNTNYAPDTGNYILVLYRSNKNIGFQFYLNSESASTNASCYSTVSAAKADGWNFAVADLSTLSEKGYNSADGLKFLRMDFFDDIGQKYQKGDSLDIAFIAFCDDSAEITALMKHYIDNYISESYVCGHTTDIWSNGLEYDVVGDKAVQISKSTCEICGKQVSRDVKYVTIMNRIKNSAGSLHDQIIITPGSVTTKSVCADAIALDQNGDLTIEGWTGVEGAISGIAYKVIASDGTVLKDWARTTGSITEAADGIKNDGAWTTHSINADPPVSYSVTADLSTLIGSQAQTVTVVFAVIPTGAVEANNGNDAYANLISFTNVTIPAKAN